MAVLQVVSPLLPSSYFFSKISQSKHQIPSMSFALQHYKHPQFSLVSSLSRINFKQHSSFGRFTITCSAHDSTSTTNEKSEFVKEKSASIILLAGGQGKRMGV
ncbi:hypothetical protein Ccrd_018721, partial [Cynara cardunculus var. scolymus]